MDVRRLLNEAFEGGLAAAVEVAVDEHDFSRRLALTSEFSRLKLTAGIHPIEGKFGRLGLG